VVGAVSRCRQWDRLDGIPLAIELAAARMVSMTPADVRDRLGDRFRLLAGERRGLERHQTLRHAVQWSYELLDHDERVVLNRSAVFAGGFDLGGAMEICSAGDFDEYRLLDILDSLVRQSLLTPERDEGHSRYSLLETIRQFAEEQLAASEGVADTRDRHAQHFTAEVVANFARWATPEQPKAYQWYGTELANLRSAFRWACDQNDLDTAATIAGKFAFPATYCQSFEPFEWCEELLDWRASSATARR
jgi:predicted ATPase